MAWQAGEKWPELLCKPYTYIIALRFEPDLYYNAKQIFSYDKIDRWLFALVKKLVFIAKNIHIIIISYTELLLMYSLLSTTF